MTDTAELAPPRENGAARRREGKKGEPQPAPAAAERRPANPYTELAIERLRSSFEEWRVQSTRERGRRAGTEWAREEATFNELYSLCDEPDINGFSLFL